MLELLNHIDAGRYDAEIVSLFLVIVFFSCWISGLYKKCRSIPLFHLRKNKRKYRCELG